MTESPLNGQPGAPSRLRTLPVAQIVTFALLVRANHVDPARRRAAGIPEWEELRAELLRREHEVEVRR